MSWQAGDADIEVDARAIRVGASDDGAVDRRVRRQDGEVLHAGRVVVGDGRAGGEDRRKYSGREGSDEC